MSLTYVKSVARSIFSITAIIGGAYAIVLVIAILMSVVGCQRPLKPQYPFVGLDVNAHHFEIDSEMSGPLEQLKAYINDNDISAVRIGVFWDWPPEHMKYAYHWASDLKCETVVFSLEPAVPGHAPAPWWAGWVYSYDATEVRWRLFARKVTKEYPHIVWMIGNEPNRRPAPHSNDPALWAAIYRVFYEEAHANRAKVIGPALGHSMPGQTNREWLKLWIQAGAKFDALAVHPYDKVEETYRDCRSLLDEFQMFNVKIHALETSGAPSKTPRQHAIALQAAGYEDMYYHVAGGWRPEDWPKVDIERFILFSRDKSNNMVQRRDAVLLAEVSREMAE